MIVSLGSSFLALKLLSALHEVHLWLIDHPPLFRKHKKERDGNLVCFAFSLYCSLIYSTLIVLSAITSLVDSTIRSNRAECSYMREIEIKMDITLVLTEMALKKN